MATKTDNVNIVFQGRDINVDFSYYPACRGHRDRYGAQEEPDEDAAVEVEKVTFKGRDITGILSCNAFDEIQQGILEMDR